MTDEKALQLIAEANDTVFDGNYNLIANLDYIVISADKFGAALTNTPGGSYLGKNLLTMTNDEWRTDIYRKSLEHCKQTRLNKQWLSLKFARKPEYWLIIINFQPLVNYATNNVIGYKITGRVPENIMLPFFGLKEIIKESQPRKRTLDSKTDEWLTNREHEVLFLLFNCDTYQHIANLLSLSHQINYTSSMVAKIVNRNLYTKFNVSNLENLKKLAYQMGYHKNIPASLFGEFMLPLNKL